MELVELQVKLHSKLLNLRNIERLLEAPSFERFWDRSNSMIRTFITLYAENGDIESIRSLMQKDTNIGIEDMCHRQLISLAKIYKILNYSRLTKTELIQSIKDHGKI